MGHLLKKVKVWRYQMNMRIGCILDIFESKNE